ncbi:hypothetical protein BT93_G0210 [Corymbia citriodora subsp. variegata]|nr:hypothetical protein BT93_G0210 [Corymbia citriodora subsp. variegata]
MIQWPPSEHVAMGAKMKSSCEQEWMSQLAPDHLRNSVEDIIHVLSIQSCQQQIWWNYYYLQCQLLPLEYTKSRLHQMP